MRDNIAIGRIYPKPFDWFGWLMCILGLTLMCKFGGIGWIFGTDKNWWLAALTVFVFWEYVLRVSFGKIYKIVYYDTIIHKMYEIQCDDRKFFVCALNEDELNLYLENTYPGLDYKIHNETIVESFIKTENHV